MTAKELREKRAALAKRIREMADKINAEGRDFNAEEKANWEAVNADYNALTRQIEIAERAESVEGEQRQAVRPDSQLPGREDRDTRQEAEQRGSGFADDETLCGPATEIRGGNAQQQAIAVQGWLRHGLGYELEQRHIDAAQACGVNPRARFLDIRIARQQPKTVAEARAMSAVTGSAGANMIAEGFVTNFESALLQFGGVLNVADVLRTTSGGPLPWPTGNDTSNTGELLGEGSATNDSTDPTIGATTFNAYTFSSKMIRVPVALLEDTAFNLPAQIGAWTGERLGRVLNTYCTTGTGSSQPNGIVAASTAGLTSGSATAITCDELYNLVHSVDPAHRVGPGVGFMFHDNALLYIRKLKDGNSRYIWEAALTNAEPDRILGFPYQINQSMAAFTNNAPVSASKHVLFGALNKYKVRMVNTIRLRRLVERYAEYDQEGFVAFMRADGDLLDAGTHPVKHLLQA